MVVLKVEIAELGLAGPKGMDVSIDLPPRKLSALHLVAIFIRERETCLLIFW